MTTTAIKNGTLSKPCLNCGKDFVFIRASKKYCCDNCKKQASRINKPKTNPKKKRLTPQQHLQKHMFGKYLVRETLRAGTVQTFPRDITTDTLEELHQLRKQCMYANGTGIYRLSKKDEYNTCHLSALIGKDGSIGYTIPANLVIAPAAVNGYLGNKPTLYSTLPHLSIKDCDLQDKWKVKKGDTAAQILRKLNKYLGGTLLAYQLKYKLKAHKGSDAGSYGLEPLPKAIVMQRALDHIQKYHGVMLKPAKGKSHYDMHELECIVPNHLAKTLLPVGMFRSYEFLLTGKFDANPAHGKYTWDIWRSDWVPTSVAANDDYDIEDDSEWMQYAEDEEAA